MATFTLNARITVEGYKPFAAVHDVVIKKSLNNHLDTAVIKLPAVAVIKGKEQSVQTALQFKRGLKISIELGYNGQYVQEFEGYIARVAKAIPCELHCEGYAFELRDKSINKIYRKSDVKTVLKDLTASTNITLGKDIDSVAIDRMDYIKYPRMEALAKLKKDLGNSVNIWFDGKQLMCGFKYLFFTEKNKKNRPDVVFKTGYNHVRDGQLKERQAGDEAYSVEIITTDAQGKQNKVNAGVANSNVQRKKLNALDATDKKGQEKVALAIDKSKSYNGVEGSITGFLQPSVKPGYKLRLIDKKYEELSGDYLVEEVETQYSTSGGRRKIKLSYKL